MKRAFLLVLLLCVPALSCGGCKKGGANNDYEPPSGELGEVLQSMCKTLDRCPTAFGTPIAYRSRSECVQILDFLLTCRLTETELGDNQSVYGVQKREVTIDDTELTACKDFLADAACDDLAGGGPCQDVLTLDFDDDDFDDEPIGTADVDESCEDDEDCKPELFCTGGGADEEQGITFCRICRPRAAEGEDCSQTPCVDGTWCKGAQLEEPLRCAAPEEDGFRCYNDEQCASGWCNQTLDEGGGWGQCDPGGKVGDDCVDEYTNPDSLQPTCRQDLQCEDGTCQPRRAPGQPCEDGYSCETGSCHEPTGVCGLPDGDPCSYDEECAANACVEDTCGLTDGQCFLDSDCSSDEVCAGACQPPNCECSGCPVGECVDAGSGGEVCVDDFDCGLGDCVNGTCQQPEIGGSCSDSSDCYPYQCVNGACAAKAGPGDDCGAIDSCQEPFLCIEGKCQVMNLQCAPAAAGDRCAWLRVCDQNSWCDLLDNVTCKPRAAVGQPCETTPIRGVQTCAQGSTCSYDEASGEQRCVRLPGVGEACTGGCAEGVCFNGRCQGAPVGDFCDYDTPCPTGLVCNEDREICVPPATQGEECEDQEDCADEFFCENYRSCEPRKTAGADCNDSFECAPELWCDRDTYTCSPRLGDGAECRSSDDACAPGFFCPSGTSTCEPARPPGSECSNAQECLSGYCYGSDFCANPMCQLPE